MKRIIAGLALFFLGAGSLPAMPVRGHLNTGPSAIAADSEDVDFRATFPTSVIFNFPERPYRPEDLTVSV